MKHVNYPLVEKTRPQMYQIHRYYSRKPPNIVAAYIESYSKKGDIVLDPFCGSGPTIAESLRLGRKAVGVDLDPVATFITRMTISPVNTEELKKAYAKIKENVKAHIENLYQTKCPLCGLTAITTHMIWQCENNNPKIEKPLELWCECSNCGKGEKKVEDEDLEKLREIEEMDVPYWYPKTRLSYGVTSFLKAEKCEYIHELFTRRALIALSVIYHEIEKLQEGIVKDLMKLTFTATLQQVSKLVIVIEKRGKMKGRIRKVKEVGSWGRPSYWIPSKHFEINVWNTFENRYKKTLRGKKQSNKEINYYKSAKVFDDLMKDSNVLILNQTATCLHNILDKSVDYVFTDPPYGDAIQYMELSTFWSSWLKFGMDYENEIIINDHQKKDLGYYHKMLKKAFEEVYRVLKQGRWLTVTFHSTKIKVWNSIIKAAILAGFDLEKIIYQPPLRASAKALRQPYGSAVGDYFIRFRKPEREGPHIEKKLDEELYEKTVIETAKRIIARRGEPVMYQHILNEIMVELHKKGALLLGEKNIDDVMRTHLNKEFVFIPVEKNGRIIGHKWWLKPKQTGATN